MEQKFGIEFVLTSNPGSLHAMYAVSCERRKTIKYIFTGSKQVAKDTLKEYGWDEYKQSWLCNTCIELEVNIEAAGISA